MFSRKTMIAWPMAAVVSVASIGFGLRAIAEDLGNAVDALNAKDAVTKPHGNAPGVNLGEYWIGVVVSLPSAVLQSQLGLPKDQGLVVEVVQPKSPAASAGIEVNDILLTANEKPLAGPGSLIGAINAVASGNLATETAKQAVTLDLMRGGKHISLSVTPAKRPGRPLADAGQDSNLADEMSKVEQWLHEVEPNVVDGNRNIYIFHPGQILPTGTTLASNLGKDVKVALKTVATLHDGTKIEITRQVGGGQPAAPAEILVTQDGKTLKVNENELQKLPENIRGDVEKLLAPSTLGAVHLMPVTSSAAIPKGMSGSAVVIPAPSDATVEQQLQTMQKKIDALNALVHELQAKASEKPAENPSGKH